MEKEEEWPWIEQASWGWSTSTTMMMIEQANEELQILETQHPNRFDYLKLELKSFISFLQSQNNYNNVVNAAACMPTLPSATTQASTTTTRKRKTKGNSDVQRVREVNDEASKNKVKHDDNGLNRSKNFPDKGDDNIAQKRRRIDVVIERAQACLRKIQLFKTSF